MHAGKAQKLAHRWRDQLEVTSMSIHDIRDQSQQTYMAGQRPAVRRPTAIARAKVYEAPKAPLVPAWLPLLLLLQVLVAWWFLSQLVH